MVEAVAGILLDLAVLVLLKIKHFEMRIREPFKKKMKVWKIPHWGLTPLFMAKLLIYLDYSCILLKMHNVHDVHHYK